MKRKWNMVVNVNCKCDNLIILIMKVFNYCKMVLY